MTLDILLYGVLIVSVLTGVVTEAIKKLVKNEKDKFSSNSIAGYVAIMLSIALFVFYSLLGGLAITPATIVYLIILTGLSWLSAMVGYDKVKQTVEQLRKVKL